MRTLCYYRQGEKEWISPGDLWQALRSGEKLTVLAPELTPLSSVLVTFDNAATELEKRWLFDTKNSLISVTWCFCAILGLLWPPLAAKMPEIVQKVLLGILGVGILAEIVSAASIWQKKRLLASGEAKIRAASRKSVKLSPPAEFYRSGAFLPRKTAKIAASCLLALFLLNSVVLAFPGRPAVVFPTNADPYIAKYPVLVFPGTQWQWRPEYYRGSVIAFLVAPEDNKSVWVVRAHYRVYADTLQDLGQWRAWMAGRLGYFVGQVSDSVWQEFPPDTSREESIKMLVESFNNAELQSALRDALILHFNTHHDGILRLQFIRLEIVELPTSQYISAYKSQQRE